MALINICLSTWDNFCGPQGENQTLLEDAHQASELHKLHHQRLLGDAGAEKEPRGVAEKAEFLRGQKSSHVPSLCISRHILQLNAKRPITDPKNVRDKPRLPNRPGGFGICMALRRAQRSDVKWSRQSATSRAILTPIIHQMTR